MIRGITLLGICLFVLSACSSRISNKEIAKSWWLYGDGYRLRDTLRFDDTNLKGDTIYEAGKAVALISNCYKGFFRRTALLEIESLETHEIGRYHDKGPK